MTSTSSLPQLPPQPSWILKDSSSFASIHVKLPPGTKINCESDAIVTFGEGIQVRGVLSGGIIAALGRFLFTNESFFTTTVENIHSTTHGAAGNVVVADVMMAASNPGGIVLHKLTTTGGGGGEGGDDDGLLLTSGSYIASDSSVKVSSLLQRSGIRNSLFAGTGFFVLKATGRGYVACGAYGGVHKYIVEAGETRAVDNGHLVAWSASMKYSVGLASRRGRGRRGGGFFDSWTSGEGLMCFFEGPGVVYLQSHKRQDASDSSNEKPSKAVLLIFVSIIAILVLFGVAIPIWQNQIISFQNGGFEYRHPHTGRDYQRTRRQQQEQQQQQRRRQPNGSPSNNNNNNRPKNLPGEDYRAQREL